MLQKLAAELAPRGLSLVTVGLEGSPPRYLRAAQRIGLTAPIVPGDPALRDDFRVASYPWTVIIGRDGKPRHALRGIHSEERFREAFEDALR